ncbi:MAG: hypothetical protein JST86_11140 [Bacteroidetes bacterium]|nr:hypothetical protein [Bacteroidota bacterium]
MKYFMPAFFCVLLPQLLCAQQKNDSTVFVGKKSITLTEVVVDHQLNVPVFIERIKNDTSFYKAFRNLHIIGFTAINDIRMNDSDGDAKATLHSKTQQLRSANCRSMITLDEQTTGDFYDDSHNYNYYTAQMYASLFFTKDSVCGEDNIVAGRTFSTAGKSGMEKHKEQLKMLFFNPGRRINGLPFMSNKTAIFDDDIADRYDMTIDFEMHDGINCYVFKQTAKPESKDDVVVDEMTTWFDQNNYEVVARNYNISYDAGIYDFKVAMEVTMTHAGNLLVPSLIRYNGNWKAIFKPRERGIFTATLFDFK